MCQRAGADRTLLMWALRLTRRAWREEVQARTANTQRSRHDAREAVFAIEAGIAKAQELESRLSDPGVR